MAVECNWYRWMNVSKIWICLVAGMVSIITIMYMISCVKFTNGELSFSLFSFFLFLEHKVRVSDGHKSWDAWKDIEGSRSKWYHTI